MASLKIIGAIILALIVIGWFYFKNRKGGKKHFETYGPLVMYHTKRGIGIIESIKNISPTFWKIFATIGVIVAFFFMADVAVGIYRNAQHIIMTPTAAAGASLVLPGLEVMGIKIPVIGWLCGILVLLFAHEFFHGIVARSENIRVESVGALFLGFLPIGAFVKPDERRLMKEKIMKKLRIFAAGSFINILISMLVVAVILFAYLPHATGSIDGIRLTAVDKNGSAYEAGLREGMVITAVNANRISGFDSFAETWVEKNYSAGEKVVFSTAERSYEAVLKDASDGRGRAGIVFCGKGIEKYNYPVQFLAPFLLIEQQQLCQTQGTLNEQLYWTGYEILLWIAIINFGVGLINLLPIKPLDGGLMVEAVVQKLIKKPKISNAVIIGISLFFFLMLLINIALPHLRNLMNF